MIIYILYHCISSIFHRRDKKVLTLLVYLLEFKFTITFVCVHTYMLFHIITVINSRAHNCSINYILNFNLYSLLCYILFFPHYFTLSTCTYIYRY